MGQGPWAQAADGKTEAQGVRSFSKGTQLVPGGPSLLWDFAYMAHLA